MSFHNNSFIRGYWGLYTQRSLFITCNRNRTRLPLHPLQAHFPDREVVQKSCLICNGYAISGTTETLSEELTAYCNKYGYEQGFVTDARYAILADDNGRSVCLGDEFPLERANEIIHRLTFKAGFCRCWEISAAHLEETASRYLKKIADDAEPLNLFSAFPIAGGQIGVKLANTPWNDAALSTEYDMSAVELWLAHQEQGMPLSLVRLLHLAGEADVRVLIFAHGAPRLHGLPVYGN